MESNINVVLGTGKTFHAVYVEFSVRTRFDDLPQYELLIHLGHDENAVDTAKLYQECTEPGALENVRIVDNDGVDMLTPFTFTECTHAQTEINIAGEKNVLIYLTKPFDDET